MGQSNLRFTVESLDVEAIRPIRHEVLRPGLPEDSTRFRGDDHPLSGHIGVRLLRNGRRSLIVAVGTVFPDPPPWDPGRAHAWRIRGMATKEGSRGQGLGRCVLDALVSHATDRAGVFIWCHARIGALDFYRRAGFVTIGDIFDDGVAIHQSMWRTTGPVAED
jgi:GNAT superfamily N-acetyltransferase